MIIERLIALLGFQTDPGSAAALGVFQTGLAEAESGISKIGTAATIAGGLIATGLVVGIGAFLHQVPDIIETGSKFEKLRIQLEGLTGSAEKGAEAFTFLQDMNRRSSLSLEEVTQAFIRMKSQGMDPLNGSMRSLLDYGAAMGKTKDEIMRMVTAVSQMQGKGHVAAEEMRQLVNAGIPAWQSMSEALGVTIEQLTKMVHDKEVGLPEIAKWLDYVGQKSAGSADKMASSWSTTTSNIADDWEKVKLQMADAGVFDRAKDAAAALLRVFDNFLESGSAGRLAKSFVDLYDVMTRFATNDRIVTFIQNTTREFTGLADALDRMTAGGLGANTIREFDNLEKALTKADEKAREFATAFGDAIKAAFTFDLGGLITSFFSKMADSVKSAGQTVIDAATDIGTKIKNALKLETVGPGDARLPKLQEQTGPPRARTAPTPDPASPGLRHGASLTTGRNYASMNSSRTQNINAPVTVNVSGSDARSPRGIGNAVRNGTLEAMRSLSVTAPEPATA